MGSDFEWCAELVWQVRLVPYGGAREVYGFNQAVMGKL